MKTSIAAKSKFHTRKHGPRLSLSLSRRTPSNYLVAGSYSPKSTLSSFTNTPSRHPLCFLHYTPRHLSLYPLFQRNQRFIGLVSPPPCTILFLFLFLSSVFLFFLLLLFLLFPLFVPPFLLLPLEAHSPRLIECPSLSLSLSLFFFLFSAKMALHSGYSLGGPFLAEAASGLRYSLHRRATRLSCLTRKGGINEELIVDPNDKWFVQPATPAACPNLSNYFA